MKKYIGEYKCRLCGAVFICGKQYTEDEAVKKNSRNSLILPLFPNDKGDIPHGCEDGSIGIADLQGFRKINEE